MAKLLAEDVSKDARQGPTADVEYSVTVELLSTVVDRLGELIQARRGHWH